VLPPRTRNTRGNEGANTKKISSNLVNNWITVASFNKALSRTFIQSILELYVLGTGNFVT
jgi:hypothetical protein